MARSRSAATVRRLPLGRVAELRGGFVPSAAEARGRARREELDRLLPPGSASDQSGGERDLGLRPSAVREDGSIDWGELVPMLPVSDPERYAIREGDLLLPLRSLRIQTVVARDVPEGVIAAGPWALLTLDPGLSGPDYLAWYMNHPRTRTRLAGLMTGSSLQFLTVGSVREFEVDLPDLVTQARIARVATLNVRVTRLERQLAAAREQLTDAVTMAALDRAAGSSLTDHA